MAILPLLFQSIGGCSHIMSANSKGLSIDAFKETTFKCLVHLQYPFHRMERMNPAALPDLKEVSAQKWPMAWVDIKGPAPREVSRSRT